MAEPLAVAGFLSSLDNSQRERFLQACESRDSAIHVWMYACAMGYEGDFLQLEGWLHRRYPRLDQCKMLLAQAIQLEKDIAALRAPVDLVDEDEDEGDARAAGVAPIGAMDAVKGVASLSKELRGHLEAATRMAKASDRRGLLLTGADRLLRILQDMFAENSEMKSALEQGFETFWSQIEDER